MSDWKKEVQNSRPDMLKAAGIILGLMFACIFGLWLLTRGLRKKPPTPTSTPAPMVKPVSPASAAP